MMLAILFDLDGTLVDSRQDLAEAVNAGLRAVGLPERSLAEITSFIGEGSRQLIEKAVAPRTDLLDAAHAAWAVAYRAGLLRHTAFYPGMLELVQTLGPRFDGRLAIHTNKPGDMARAILAGLGAEKLFARVVGDGDGSARKPAPDGARLLLRGFAVAPAQAVYVGDSLVDLETAAAASLAFLGCGWGYGHAEALRARGARVARDAEELGAWLGAR